MNNDIIKNATEIVKARASTGNVTNEVLLELLAKTIKLLRSCATAHTNEEDTKYRTELENK